MTSSPGNHRRPETRIVSENNVYESVRFSPRSDYIYLCNYKSACTTVLLSLARREYRDGLLANMPDEDTVHAAGSLWQFDFAWAGVQPYAFAFVRNPYSRAISAYLDKIARDGDPHRGQFCAARGLSPNIDITFRDFLTLIRDVPSAQDDAHWRLQSHNLLLGGFRLDLVGHLEHFAEDFELVRAAVALGPAEEVSGSSHATRAADLVGDFYTHLEVALVNEIFQEDFLAFSYPFDPTRLQPTRRQLSFGVEDHALHHFIRGVGLRNTDPEAARSEWTQAMRCSNANPHIASCLDSLSR